MSDAYRVCRLHLRHRLSWWSLGTTGQLHHHLRALVAAGWLASTGRGSWQVPASRVIPLLVVVIATTPR